MHNVGMETQNMVGTWGDQENFVKHVIPCQLKWQLKFSHSQITAHIYICTYVSTYIHESGCPYGD
jgi:hypothetical protein